MTITIWPGVVLDAVGQKIVAIAEYYPDKQYLYVTSSKRDEPGSYHSSALVYGGSPTAAVDFGAGGVTPEGSARMRDFARWLIQFASNLIEEIHTTPYADDNGFYVKNQKVADVYDAATKAAHGNHIHAATSAALADRILAQLAALPATTPAPTPTPEGPSVTIYGVDLSDYDTSRGNSPAIVAKYRAAGISWLTHKTTETTAGQVFKHSNLGRMLTAGRDAGIPFLGGYVVPRSGVAVATQGANHVAFLDAQVPWWRTHPGFFHQVDLEKWPYDAVPASVGNDLFDWLRANGGGKPVVLYASKGQYGSSALRYPRWNANYPSATAKDFKALYVADGGDSGDGWQSYGSPARVAEIWQYGSSAIVAGQGTTDANAFRGTEADFAAMLGATVPTTPPPATTPSTTPTGVVELTQEASDIIVWNLKGWELEDLLLARATATKVDALTALVTALAKSGGVDAAELAAIGATVKAASSSASADIAAAVVAGVLAQLPASAGLSKTDVESAVKAVFAGLAQTP